MPAERSKWQNDISRISTSHRCIQIKPILAAEDAGGGYVIREKKKNDTVD